MAWGDAAAEQHEQDQPSEPLTDDRRLGVSPAKEPLIPEAERQAYKMLARVRERAAARQAES